VRAISPRFFRTPAAWRAWLAKNHDRVELLWVGFHKKGSGRAGIALPEAVEEAICFGWIDGQMSPLDAHSYAVRFTPRKARSYWSKVNTRRANALIAAGRMAPAGLAAFERRDAAATEKYSFEREQAALDPAFEKRFRANRRAWAHWQERPPGYRRTATFWVMSARKAETREKRLATLIACSAEGRPIPALARPGGA
jgi:uncharacterized protein YdeI (YjbR/CyaY-like superfamily)